MGTMTTTTPGVYAVNTLTGKRTPITADAVEFVLPTGDTLSVRPDDEHAAGVTVRNVGRRLSSGLMVQPRAQNTVVVLTCR